MRTDLTTTSCIAQPIFSGADVIPFNNPAKEEYTAAIRMWCVDRSLSNALKPEEIGALQALDRIDAQRKAIIIGLSHYYRKHERADVAPGVAVIIALLSDNDKGLATISQPTLASLFGRSRSAIGDAQKRLKDDGLIGMTRGRYAGSFPIIPREVTKRYNHMTWLVEALNTQDGALNLPAPPADCQSTGPTGGLRPINRPEQRIEKINQPVEPVSINRPDATQLHYKNSKEERGSLTKVATAIAATFATAIPIAAAAHPVDQVVNAPAECWQTQKAKMAAMMDANIAKLQRQIWVTPTGRVEVAGDLKADLEREYPLVDLKCGLAAAAPNVKPDAGPLNCIQTVFRQFGYMQQEAMRKLKTAEAYRQKPPETSKPKVYRKPNPWD